MGELLQFDYKPDSAMQMDHVTTETKLEIQVQKLSLALAAASSSSSNEKAACNLVMEEHL